MLTAAAVLGVVLHDGGNEWTRNALLLYPLIVLVMLRARARYRPRLRYSVLDGLTAGFGAVSIGAMVILAAGVGIGGEEDAAALLLPVWGLSLVLLSTGGVFVALLQRKLYARGTAGTNAIIVGADRFGRDIAAQLSRNPGYGLRPVAILADEEYDEEPTDLHPPIVGGLDDLTKVARAESVGHVIVAFPAAEATKLLGLVRACDEQGLEVTVVPRLTRAINHQTQFEYLGTLPVLNLRAVDPASWRFTLKHILDRLAAAILLLLLAPVFAVIAAAIKLTSAGPVIFRQVRAGRDGRVFVMLKFRTMREFSEEALEDAFTAQPGLAPGGIEGSDRRTCVGGFLRKTSLDELPQLVNVLRGDMSLIGPRPERPEFAELFQQEVERYGERHRVRSGITGWAQVNGLRGQTSLVQRVEYDNFYIEHWSPALDLKIMLLTLPALLRGR
jgi:exopolysaccharide biosynthesis polyprenyl glycosylphosphotransferase